MSNGMLSAIALSQICFLSLIWISSTNALRDPNNYFMYDSHRIDTRSARRYCGSEITRTLTFLCESYNKRSHRSDDQENENSLTDDGFEPQRYSLALVKILGNDNELRYYRRQIRGVVDDCCKRSCTTNQLAQYCDVVRSVTTTPITND